MESIVCIEVGLNHLRFADARFWFVGVNGKRLLIEVFRNGFGEGYGGIIAAVKVVAAHGEGRY